MDLEEIKKIFEPYKWNKTTNNYRVSGKVAIVRGCNGYMATNTGDDPVLVDGERLFPSTTPLTVLGDSINIFGNQGEILGAEHITVQFAGTGVAPNVVITQKFYLAYDQG